MQIDKIRSRSENIKREKRKYLKWLFFDHFGIFLGQFCLKAIPEIKYFSTGIEILASTVKRVHETRINKRSLKEL